MDVRHTPGPWLLDNPDSIGVADLATDDYHFVEAGVGVHGSDVGVGFSFSAVISTADGRLIAAAPDMLAALRRVADFIKEQDGGEPAEQTGWKSDEFLSEWLNITAAIAKAEGRTT